MSVVSSQSPRRPSTSETGEGRRKRATQHPKWSVVSSQLSVVSPRAALPQVRREREDGILATSGVQLATASSKAQKAQKVSDIYGGAMPPCSPKDTRGPPSTPSCQLSVVSPCAALPQVRREREDVRGPPSTPSGQRSVTTSTCLSSWTGTGACSCG